MFEWLKAKVGEEEVRAAELLAAAGACPSLAAGLGFQTEQALSRKAAFAEAMSYAYHLEAEAAGKGGG